MASSSDEQPKPLEPPAASTAVVAVAPATHAGDARGVGRVAAGILRHRGAPYAWPAQHLMTAAAVAAVGAPYGVPVPFSIYHLGAAAACYAHASMAAGVPYPTAEAVTTVAAAAAVAAAVPEGDGEGKGAGTSPEKGSSTVPYGDDAAGVPYPTAEAAAATAAAAVAAAVPEEDGKGKGASASPEKGSSVVPYGDDASRSGDSSGEESSETRDHKDSSVANKRKSGNRSAEGESSQAALVPYASVESPYQLKGRSASKLSVRPGRATLPNSTPNLNIGIDIWSASLALAVLARQEESNTGWHLPDVMVLLNWMNVN